MIDCPETGNARGEGRMEVQTTSKSFGKKRRERYSCSFCGKLYLTKQGLELHRPSHMGIKPFICSYCNKGFSQNGVLKSSHELIIQLLSTHWTSKKAIKKEGNCTHANTHRRKALQL
nr:fez family zinc finger protein erm isoform X2 [Crassostrea gigas]